MAQASRPVYEFAGFRYDSEQRLLFRDGELVALLPKVAYTLHVLLERHGRVVEKPELMRLVWPDTTVEEIGLARNISLLRKALGDDADSDGFIETLPRRGYRFAAEVRVLSSNGIALPAAAVPASAESWMRRRRRLWFAGSIVAATLLAWLVYWQFYRPSQFLSGGEGYANLAVVPFECLSPEIGCGTFSRSFTELLAADLSKQPDVHVISPSTVERYRRARISMAWMGRLLGLEVLLEGTAQKTGDRVRITARLGDVHSGKLVWAETYEYPAADLDRAEAEAARAIAAQVGRHLAARGASPASR
jgi:DNA-binding winged helix-turn-helix (wHTH) protein/TolB-like protein